MPHSIRPAIMATALLSQGFSPALLAACAGGGSREDLLSALRKTIDTGSLPPGRRLPGERALALATGRNRETIRWVLRELLHDGLIDNLGRGGWIVRAPAIPALGRDSLILLHRTRLGPEAPAPSGESRSLWLLAQRLSADGIVPVHIHPAVAAGKEASAAIIRAQPRAVALMGDSLSSDLQRSLLTHLERTQVIILAATAPHHGFATIRSDHAAGQAALVRHCHALGARRIQRLYAVEPDQAAPWLDDRDRGHAEACRVFGIEELPAVRFPHSGNIWTRRHQDDLLHHTLGWLHGLADRRFDALCCTTDAFAHVAAEALRRLDPGTGIPVTGYDGYVAEEEPLAWRHRLAASIDKGAEAMAEAACRILAGAAERDIAIVPRLISHA